MSDRPEVCPKCGAAEVPRPDWDRVTLFHCGSTPGVQSTDCKLTCYVASANQQISALTAQLQAAEGKLVAIEDAMTGTNSDKIECSIVWDILHPAPPAPPAGDSLEPTSTPQAVEPVERKIARAAARSYLGPPRVTSGPDPDADWLKEQLSNCAGNEAALTSIIYDAITAATERAEMAERERQADASLWLAECEHLRSRITAADALAKAVEKRRKAHRAMVECPSKSSHYYNLVLEAGSAETEEEAALSHYNEVSRG